MQSLRVLDLFSGIAGFSVGLARTGGFKTVGFCEIDPFCQRLLAERFPGIPCHGDVTTYDFKEGEADVITAGFPCQDISIAGDGAGLSGSRSGLYREVIRAIRVVRPLYTVLENVAALLGRGLGVVLGDLAEIGNDAEWDCVPVGRLGAPHIRDRVWILTHPNSGGWRTSFAGRDNAYRQDAGWSQANGLLGALPEPDRQWYLAPTVSPDNHSQRRRQYHRSEIAVQPEITGLAGEISHDGWNTPWPRFLADLCRVDDGLRGGLDKAAFQHLGNAVSPQIPELIGEAILASIASSQSEVA